jgi:hypothetical protein
MTKTKTMTPKVAESRGSAIRYPRRTAKGRHNPIIK